VSPCARRRRHWDRRAAHARRITDGTGCILPEGPYTTVAGFFMAQLNAVPNLGDRIVIDVEAVSDDEPRRVPLEFRVIEMDGHRAARFACTGWATTNPMTRHQM
jgi:CBS domain containing-hemolysin-like protein